MIYGKEWHEDVTIYRIGVMHFPLLVKSDSVRRHKKNHNYEPEKFIYKIMLSIMSQNENQ